MKKLFACLLALMLPFCAVAETVSVNWSAEVSPEGLTKLIDLMQTSFPDGNFSLTDKQIDALAKFMSGFSVTFDKQEDEDGNRMLLVLAHGDEALADLAGMTQDDENWYTSSLLPGLLLTAPRSAASSLTEEVEAAWANQPWLALEARYRLFSERWENSLDRTVRYGVFVGDAYSGGRRCTTYRFDERDVAVLLESIITADRSDDIATLLSYYSLQFFDDRNELTGVLCRHIRDAAMENRYSYVLRVVDDGTEAAKMIGLSLLVYEKDQLVATLSASPDTVVLGYGLRGENCYLSMTFSAAADTPRVLAKLWRDPYKAGYTAASRDEANLLATASLYWDESSNPLSVRAELSGSAFYHIPITATFTVMDDEFALSISVDNQLLSTSRVTVNTVDDMPAMETEGLQRIDSANASKDDLQAMSAAFHEASIALSVKLFKLLPPELLTLFLTGF